MTMEDIDGLRGAAFVRLIDERGPADALKSAPVLPGFDIALSDLL